MILKGLNVHMKKLRKGYTTGVCAAAAAKAAAVWLTSGSCPETIEITLNDGMKRTFPVIRREPFSCGVVKDAGDDPDVTDGCMVCARIENLTQEEKIKFFGGEGIGTVTRPGLKIAVGEPAINPAPRAYITRSVREVIGSHGADITLSIPGGAILAERTFNPRLGIEGGLSILGTTGIVNPMSEEAVKESLVLELSMHAEEGTNLMVLCVSGAGERLFKTLYPDISSVMQMSNFTGFMLDQCVERGISKILIFGGAGKLTKLAADIMNTHSHIAGGAREVICTHAALLGGGQDLIRRLFAMNTTQEAETVLKQHHMETVWRSVVKEAKCCCEKRCRNTAQVEIIMTGAQQSIIAVTEGAEQLLKTFRKG